MALVSDIVTNTYDGCTLTQVYDDTIYDAATDSFQVVSVSASNPTGANGFPARNVTVWAIYKGNHASTSVAPGQTKTWTPTGHRTVADISSFGLG